MKNVVVGEEDEAEDKGQRHLKWKRLFHQTFHHFL